MVFSSSDHEQEQLGAMLLVSGKKASQQYQDTLTIAEETGKSHGAMLVEMRCREHKTLGDQGVLGLLLNASSSKIRHAYHAMAKDYHPDRYLLLIGDEGLRE